MPWDMPSHGMNVCECPVMTCLRSVCLHQKCSPGEGRNPLEEDELQKCQLCKQASKEVSWIPSPGICRRLSLLQVVPASPTHPAPGFSLILILSFELHSLSYLPIFARSACLSAASHCGAVLCPHREPAKDGLGC